MSTEEQNPPEDKVEIGLNPLVAQAAREAVVFTLPPTPEGTGLEEALRAWRMDEGEVLATNALTLVSNRGDRDVEMEALEVRRQSAISALKDAIPKAEGVERDDLEKALDQLESAKTPNDINAAISNATTTLSREGAGGGSKSADGDAERQQLWGEIGKLNNKVGNIMNPHMSEEERKKDEEYRERIRNARTEEERLAIQREYTRWRQQVIDDWRQSGDPAKEKAADRAQPILDEIERDEEKMGRMFQQGQTQRNATPENTVPAAPTDIKNGQTQAGIIASGEANIASLGDLPSGTTATTARRPGGDQLERV